MAPSQRAVHLNDHLGPAGGPVTLVEIGDLALVCSAPHAVHRTRDGALKLNDANTGGLALAPLVGPGVTVLDLHGMADRTHDLRTVRADRSRKIALLRGFTEVFAP